ACPDAELPCDDELCLAWFLRDQSPLDLTLLELRTPAPNVSRVQRLRRNNLSSMDFFKSQPRDNIRSRRRDQTHLQTLLTGEICDPGIRRDHQVSACRSGNKLRIGPKVLRNHRRAGAPDFVLTAIDLAPPRIQRRQHLPAALRSTSNCFQQGNRGNGLLQNLSQGFDRGQTYPQSSERSRPHCRRKPINVVLRETMLAQQRGNLWHQLRGKISALERSHFERLRTFSLK